VSKRNLAIAVAVLAIALVGGLLIFGSRGARGDDREQLVRCAGYLPMLDDSSGVNVDIFASAGLVDLGARYAQEIEPAKAGRLAIEGMDLAKQHNQTRDSIAAADFVQSCVNSFDRLSR
jgi:hypothetical protein